MQQPRIVIIYTSRIFCAPDTTLAALALEHKLPEKTKRQMIICDHRCNQPHMYYYGKRYYSPEMGRWINRDPIEEKGGVNVYRVIHNNPINKFDIIGLLPPGYGLVYIGVPGLGAGNGGTSDRIYWTLFSHLINPGSTTWTVGHARVKCSGDITVSTSSTIFCCCHRDLKIKCSLTGTFDFEPDSGRPFDGRYNRWARNNIAGPLGQEDVNLKADWTDNRNNKRCLQSRIPGWHLSF
jgi:RHS repeat-associated protein